MAAVVSDKLAEYFSRSKVFLYQRGETILRSDDTPQGIYFLEQGFVKMNALFPDGRELTLNIFKPGTYFPMMWAIADIPNTHFYQAVTLVKIRRMPRDSFKEFLNRNPEILLDFTQRILVGLDGILNSVRHLLSGDAYHRVASAVMLFSRRFGVKNPNGQIAISLPLTHQDIADSAGITRETASLAVSKLQDKGIIAHHYRRLTILRPDLLETESFTDSVRETAKEAI